MPPGNLRGHGAGVRGADQHRQRRRPLPGNRGSNRSRGSVGNAQLVTGPATSGSAWGQAGEELVDGKAGHARGADPGQVCEAVHSVHATGRPERQRGAMARW